jgi:hypothetical protein
VHTIAAAGRKATEAAGRFGFLNIIWVLRCFQWVTFRRILVKPAAIHRWKMFIGSGYESFSPVKSAKSAGVFLKNRLL